MNKQQTFGESTMDENWLQCFEEHNVQFVVLSQIQDKELVQVLRHRPEWLIDFEGGGTVIFARSVAAGLGRAN